MQASVCGTRLTHYWNQQVVEMPADTAAAKLIPYEEKHIELLFCHKDVGVNGVQQVCFRMGFRFFTFSKHI